MKVTYKRGKRRDPDEIVAALRRVARQTAELVQDDYDSVTSNWNTQVEFSVEDRSTGEDLVFNIYARGENSDIFGYVDHGTEKRYAVMSKAFIARTAPGSLRSAGGGNRRPAYFDYDESRARSRAIEAREFGKTIVENRKASFVDSVKATLRS